MKKVTTKHGTYYLIDLDKGRALRVKGEHGYEFIKDNTWFALIDVFAFDRNAKDFEDAMKGEIQVGYSMYFRLRSFERIPWILSSIVVSIEEVEDNDAEV